MNLPRRIAETFLPLAAGDSIQLTPVPPGMSGGIVHRCDVRRHGDRLQCFALKRWPGGVSADRVTQLHRLLIHVAARLGGGDESAVTPVPIPRRDPVGGATVIVREGSVWDMTTWIPGRPAWQRGDRSSTTGLIDRIDSGAGLIARFHVAAGLSPADAASVGVAATVTDRLRRLEAFGRFWQSAIAHRSAGRTGDRSAPPPLQSAFSAATNWLKRCGPATAQALHLRLLPWANRPTPLGWVIRDVHRDHVLFCDGADQPSGIIDFDAVRWDTPAADLARWAGSFSEPVPPRAALDAAVAGYRRFASLCDRQRELTEVLMEVHPFLSLVNWVDWIGSGSRDFPAGPVAVAERMEELLSRARAAER